MQITEEAMLLAIPTIIMEAMVATEAMEDTEDMEAMEVMETMEVMAILEVMEVTPAQREVVSAQDAPTPK